MPPPATVLRPPILSRSPIATEWTTPGMASLEAHVESVARMEGGWRSSG
ncbi:hypothetical protein ES288_D12G180000v1 [Gossypium darwinii]|uniref:Uncharacterized protein n=2 Tax=Gossypium TaxID=3633 RepID=A0A5D2IC38_GOSTO|nr:hypothetical protein ES288_D12G180000v1 [Gossypium darwinii]TYH39469.1 hypothetical protein ES332_D12G181100v1 [Gossypium tomentosum]